MLLAEEKVAFLEELRQSVRAVCKAFPDTYWRKIDEQQAYPTEFVKALTDAGFLAALIPEEYGGGPWHYRSVRYFRRNQSFWWKLWGVSCPNVYDGNHFTSWFG